MTTNAEHAAACHQFAADAASQRSSYGDLAMFAELQNMPGSDEAAAKIQARSDEGNRLQAAWLILAVAFKATDTIPEVSGILDVIDLAETRALARQLLATRTGKWETFEP